MSIALLLFIIEYFLMLLLNQKLRNTVFDAFFFVMSPYVFIIAINNLFMTKLGFFEVDSEVIVIHALAMLLFYAGSVAGQYLGARYKIKTSTKEYRLADVHPKSLVYLSFFCVGIVCLDLVRLIAQYGMFGVLGLGDSAKRGYIASHLLILFVPLSILLIDYFFETKKKKYLCLSLVMLLLIFSTFIKYHIIAAILSVFIYVALTRPKLVKKIGVIALMAVVALFILNYLLNFIANQVTVSSQFYLNHLWKYIAGGTINVKTVSEYVKAGEDLSMGAWIWGMLSSFPLMILSRMLGVSFQAYHFSTVLPLFFVGIPALEEQSNVISLLGAAYAQSNGITFYLFLFFWGLIVQWIFEGAKKSASIRHKLVSSIFLGYNMLSFFSSFFELSTPWETVVLAYAVFLVFRVRIGPGTSIADRIEY